MINGETFDNICQIFVTTPPFQLHHNFLPYYTTFNINQKDSKFIILKVKIKKTFKARLNEFKLNYFMFCIKL